jgi:hypothetical protein
MSAPRCPDIDENWDGAARDLAVEDLGSDILRMPGENLGLAFPAFCVDGWTRRPVSIVLAASGTANLVAVATTAHTRTAMASGISAPNNVHFSLRVSRQIVQMVVPQGLCSSEYSIRHTAVSSVQPWSVRMLPRTEPSSDTIRL